MTDEMCMRLMIEKRRYCTEVFRLYLTRQYAKSRVRLCHDQYWCLKLCFYINSLLFIEKAKKIKILKYIEQIMFTEFNKQNLIKLGRFCFLIIIMNYKIVRNIVVK
jgi:hypothetical protein